MRPRSRTILPERRPVVNIYQHSKLNVHDWQSMSQIRLAILLFRRIALGIVNLDEDFILYLYKQ